MQPIRILIAGCGDLGIALGLRLASESTEVVGMRRTINQLPDPIQPLPADLTQPDTFPNLPACDYLVYCAAAKSRDPSVYRAVYVDGLHHLLRQLPQPPKHLFLTSSTGVYAQSDGEWVDEFSPTHPTSETGKILLESESIALNASSPATVVRFSGIYGPGRTHLLDQVRAGIQAPEKPQHYSNRIHRDDCAGFIQHLIASVEQGKTLAPLYLASDDQPTPISAVTGWLAKKMDVTITEQREIRRGGSKRCSNLRMKSTGYRLRYPDYQAGFNALLEGTAP
ncbi:MAG: NAD(P)-dependent oxidoreductase [Oceanospirillaceae bacterium]|uniref:SDR family oxidoreductase n=1 Tax=Marinobacterium litorale TaxID=404770 RepID=UPI00041FC69E|nr:SDR family oxidoreductase [Marinobacterium litorale]MBS99149.1 NAD(P)-dependent oxidoreductase [Oceanospirillaceae bacterium]